MSILHGPEAVWVLFLCTPERSGADSLLPVTLADGQFEWLMARGWREAFMVRVAAVADDRVADRQVKNAINDGRADQNRPGQKLFVPEIGKNRGQTGDHKDGHAEPVREVLLPVQLVVAADGAAAKQWVGGTDLLLVVAGRALPTARRSQADAGRTFTAGTGKTDIHDVVLQEQSCFFDQELTGQLAKIANDHHDVQDPGC